MKHMKQKINLPACKYADSASLDAEGNLSHFADGSHGHRVFYTVPKEELEATGLFSELPENCIGGELEFAVNAEGKQEGEVLLWITVMDNEDDITNTEFEFYDGDVALLADDFKWFVDSEVYECRKNLSMIEILEKKGYKVEDHFPGAKVRWLLEKDHEQALLMDERSDFALGDFIRDDDDNQTYGYGIFLGGMLAGYCSIGQDPDDEGDEDDIPLVLSDVYIREEFRGHGLGTTLVKSAVMMAFETERASRTLTGSIMEEDLGGFYGKMGFDLIAQYPEFPEIVTELRITRKDAERAWGEWWKKKKGEKIDGEL